MSPAQLSVRRESGRIWSPIRERFLLETPEESVRQEYLCDLVNEYGFQLSQIAEEQEVTGRGSGRARADFVIWRTGQDRAESRNPLIVVECKSDNVTIRAADYGQGDNYARLTGARFFVTHNRTETKYWRVRHQEMPKSLAEIANIPHADFSDRQIDDLISRLKVFKEDEFATLLHQCHNVIRNREKLDPAAAFDEIAKILFVKVFVERSFRARRQRKDVFTVDYLDDQLGPNPLNDLFERTKEAYQADRIFSADDEIRLRPGTGREIVRLLEQYNLSDTAEDIKGIAFERFLGRTFRGEIGQFFTPRTIVEFMTRMVGPTEGELVCDPASGSGGFLIRVFELVRQQILADADRQYQRERSQIEASRLDERAKAEALTARYAEIQESLDQGRHGSRMWTLANRCIYGTDANERMARTSKMNMIMHGDGHGGVHHHDGFLNVNGVFDGRFDIVLTNPPFGASVEPSDVVHESDVLLPSDVALRYQSEYGESYEAAVARVRDAVGQPIASLFELPRGKQSKTKTEILFLERCLALLKPGGRLGIVLPEGIFNNPSLAYVREFCEDRAFIRAIVSLPQETFYSSGASVKASLLFLTKFTDAEQADFDRKKAEARTLAEERGRRRLGSRTNELESAIREAIKENDPSSRKRLEGELRQVRKQAEATIRADARSLLKEAFSYTIFMYAAEHVGITATGEADLNELYPNDAQPSGALTCLELFEAYLRDRVTNAR
jgi:type I restriction enzyme M protein